MYTIKWIRVFFVVGALLSVSTLRAQQQDSTQVEIQKKKKHKKDSIRPDFRPVSFRVGTDLIGIVKTIVDQDKREFDISTDIVFHKYLFNVELGRFEVTRNEVFRLGDTDNALLEGESYTYNNSGNYLRFGPDINLLKNDPDRSVLFFGVRYGMSRFDNDISFSLQENVWPGTDLLDQTRSNRSVRASWFEATTGMKVQIFKSFWLGYTARLKFALNLKGDDDLAPFDVPGFGRAAENTYWGFNYYLFYTFPLRNKTGQQKP